MSLTLSSEHHQLGCLSTFLFLQRKIPRYSERYPDPERYPDKDTWLVSKIKSLADLMSHETLLPGSYVVIFSLCPHTMDGARELSGILLYKHMHPIYEGVILTT